MCLNNVMTSASVRRRSISQSIVTGCLQTDKRVSVENFCGLILHHNSAYETEMYYQDDYNVYLNRLMLKTYSQLNFFCAILIS